MALTPKQEAFCLAFLETGNASEAYRRSYDAGRMKPETINRAAKELADNPKITARVAELRQPAVDAAIMTFGGHLKRLNELAEMAAERGQLSAAIAAEVARGKVWGFYVDRTEIAGPNGGPLQAVSMAPEEFRAIAAGIAAKV